MPTPQVVVRAQICSAPCSERQLTFACATAAQSQADRLARCRPRRSSSSASCPTIRADDGERKSSSRNCSAPPPCSPRTTGCDPARPALQAAGQGQGEVGVQIVQRWVLARLRQQRFFAPSTGSLPRCSNRSTRTPSGACRAAARTLECRPSGAARLAAEHRFSTPSGRRPSPGIGLPRRVRQALLSVPYALAAQAVDCALPRPASSALLPASGSRHGRSPRAAAPWHALTEHMPASIRRYSPVVAGELIPWGNWDQTRPPGARPPARTRPSGARAYRACLGLMRLARQYHGNSASKRPPTAPSCWWNALPQPRLHPQERVCHGHPTGAGAAANQKWPWRLRAKLRGPLLPLPAWRTSMLTQHSLEHLHTLRLEGMACAFKEQLAKPRSVSRSASRC